MSYKPSDTRYDKMIYNRCGRSGILLPAISLGLWHNFGSADDFKTARNMIRFAFDQGITHFDLANNYGPEPGSAEENFGKILKTDFTGNLRDELIISTKAGYLMWPGPYGDNGSRKYLLSSLDQSLKRMKLDYVDIFYSHRPDTVTPIEETMMALDTAVKSGKALYAGLSSYDAVQTKEAVRILKELGTPCLIHQPKYSMLERWVEKPHGNIGKSLLDILQDRGIGCIAFSPLAQGMLSSKYLDGIPGSSRAAKKNSSLNKSLITDAVIMQLNALNNIAKAREQSLAQMAISWLLKNNRVTSVLVGASSVKQLEENIRSLNRLDFTDTELAGIEAILKVN